MGLHLEPFTLDSEFKAAKNFRFGGHAVVKDAILDKRLVPDDKLKLLYETHYIVVASDDEVKAAGRAPAALTDEQTKRVADLVASNDRAGLDAMATAEPHLIADAATLATKADVATAIVASESAQA